MSFSPFRWSLCRSLALFVGLTACTGFPGALRAADLVFAPGIFDSNKLAQMSAAITNAIAEKKLPGAVLWLERLNVSYHREFGHRALVPAEEPMTDTTIFDVASLTKVVATTPAIMLLVERGKVRLDAPVKEYIPQFQGEGTAGVTVRHLLTHTSGLRPGLSSTPEWQGYDVGIRLACLERATNAPGTTFRYSDINFILLGEIVQRVSGERLDAFVAKEIYTPLRMHFTGYRPSEALRQLIAPTEQSEQGILRGVVHDPTARRMGGVAGHAGLFSTAADLARYARMILNGGVLEEVRLFQPETVRLMTSVQSPSGVISRRGLGWDIDSSYSRPRGQWFPLGSFGHTGWTGTCLWLDPFSKTFWIFLSNRVHPDGKGNTLALYTELGTLAAEAVTGFNFKDVPGSLAPRTNTTHGAMTVAAAAKTNAPALARTNAPAPPARTTNAPKPAVAVAATNAVLPRPQAPVVAAPTNEAPVLTGTDVLVKQNFAPLRRMRLGLITNHTGTDRRRNPTIDLLFNAPEVQLKALFSPEHGIRGELDDKVEDGVDDRTGLPIYSLYPKIPKRATNQTEAEFETMALRLRSPSGGQLMNLDALVFDIQDIGCRFYTYSASLGTCLEASRRARVKFFVLDRPNPINGVAVEGPVYNGHAAFVAYHRVPLRHGMTLGELARMYNAERNLKADLTVIPVEGWRRNQWFDETGLGWINPSPNMRSLPGAILYPGVGLLESAISVGRGTDKPFEMIGAPYIDDLELATVLNRSGLEGVRFVPVRFTPSYSTFTNQPCGGVSILITDRERVQAVDVGITIAVTLQKLYPRDFALKKMVHLLRHEPTLEAIRAGKPLAEIKKLWQPDLAKFRQRRTEFLIYK